MKSLDQIFDECDKQIITLLEENPNITYLDIATKLNRSQPFIGTRVKRLFESGFIKTLIGVDFQKNDYIHLVMVSLMTTRQDLLLKMAMTCPFVINALKTSGDYNIILFLACSDLRRLDRIVDVHFRNKTFVNSINFLRINEAANTFILPFDFRVENFEKFDEKCKNCTEACFQGIHNPVYDIPSQSVVLSTVKNDEKK